MGKKVKVTTKCGETFYYDHDQEVETVEIVKTPELPNEIKISLRRIASVFENHLSYAVDVSLIDNQTLKLYVDGTMNQAKDIYEELVKERDN